MAYQITATVYPEGDYVGMPDVIITEVGTTKSTKTNSQGNFSFSATSANSQIRFQMLGYKEKVVRASEVSTFVNLEAEHLDLDEITIIGGGKRDNTLLYLALAATTIIVTATIITKNRNRPQKVQLK